MSSATETAVLRRFVGLLLAPAPEPPWDDLFPAGGHAGARAAYFLLHRDPEGGPDAEGFVTGTLERLLQQLSSRTERQLAEYQGRVRGQVLWSATLKSRYSGDYDPTRFVCREVRRRFDTLENQLLRYVVEKVWQCHKAVPAAIRSGVCYYPAGGRYDPATIGERLSEIETMLPRLRAHVRLREITLPRAVTPEHLVAAQTSKLEEYGLVAELYERLADCVLARSWRGVRRLGRESLPLPAETGGEAEPWLRLAAAICQQDR